MCHRMVCRDVSWNGIFRNLMERTMGSVMEENVGTCSGVGYLAVSWNGMLGYVIDWNVGKFHGMQPHFRNITGSSLLTLGPHYQLTCLHSCCIAKMFWV